MVQQGRAARTKEALLRAAAEAFADEGFVLTTLSNISKNAGVSNGALHFHFENKDALAHAVEAAAIDALRHITQQADEQPGCALQRLIDATYALTNTLHDNVVVRAGFELLAAAPRRKEATDLRGEWQHWITTVLHTAHQNGELAHDIKPAEAATAVVAATTGFEVLGARNPAWVSQQTLTQYWQLILPRLASPATLAVLAPHGTHSRRH